MTKDKFLPPMRVKELERTTLEEEAKLERRSLTNYLLYLIGLGRDSKGLPPMLE